MSQYDPRCYSLPEQIISDILSRLPVKSLLRFRCVSRSWRSLIDSTSFAKLHLQRSPKNTNFLLLGIDTDPALVLSYSLHSLTKETIPFDSQSLGFGQDLTCCFWVNGAINGLSCVSSVISCEMNYSIFNVRLWNPVTRLISAASPPLYVENNGCANIVKFGLGYDDSTNTYKVVANIIDRRQWKNELRVYSRPCDTCWRTVPTPPDLLLSWEQGEFVSNSFNWLAIRPPGPIDHERIDRLEYTYDDYVIFSLDVGQETHKLLRMPIDLDDYNREEPKLVVLKDHLCVFVDFEGTHFVVWQMQEFGVEDSWTILMRVSYVSLQVDACSCSFRDYSQFNISEDGNYLLVYNKRDSVLLVYDERVREVTTCTNLCNNHRWVGVNGYVQSLVSPE